MIAFKLLWEKFRSVVRVTQRPGRAGIAAAGRGSGAPGRSAALLSRLRLL